MSAQPRNLPAPSASWMPVEEFLTISGLPRTTFFHQKKRGKHITKKDGKFLFVSSESLPASALTKLESLGQPNGVSSAHHVRTGTNRPSAAPPKSKHVDPSTTMQVTSPLFAGVGPQGLLSSPQRVSLSSEQQLIADERLATLQPLLNFCNDPSSRARYQQLPLASGALVSSSNDLAEYIAAHSPLNISASTLWNWKREYLSRGLEGLVRKQRSDKGRAKWVENFPNAAKIAAAVYTSSHQTKRQAFDSIIINLSRLGMRRADLPSYSSVCNWLDTIPAAARVLGRLGEKAHNERMAPHLRRKYTDMAANEVWVSDTMIHDVLVRDDCFNRDQAAVRLQLTAIMDMRSRKIVGYAWILDGSSRSITTALIRAVRSFGPCINFYCDNGKDYQKVGRFARSANLNAQTDEEVHAIERTGALRQLGIGVTFCIKYRPQSKPIERFFGTLHKRFDALFPHYTTGNAYLRPDATTEAAATHGKLLRMNQPKLMSESPLLTASRFIELAQSWIELDYNAGHSHSGEGMNGRAANDVFDELYPIDSRRTADTSAFALLLASKEVRKVRESCVELKGKRLIGVTSADTEMLYRANETKVTVCFDPNDAEHAIVTDLTGHKIADVRAEILVTQSHSSPEEAEAAGELISESLRTSRGLRNNTAASVRGLRKYVAGSGFITGLQDIAERTLPSFTATPESTIVAPIAVAATGTYGKNFHSEDVGDALAASMQRRTNGTD